MKFILFYSVHFLSQNSRNYMYMHDWHKILVQKQFYSAVHKTFDSRFATSVCGKFRKFASNLGISIHNCQSNGKLSNELGNFVPNFVGMWRSNFHHCSRLLFYNECLQHARKGNSKFCLAENDWKLVRMERTISNRTGNETSQKTIAKIVDIFVRRGNIEDNKWRNITRSARAEWCE